MKYNASVVNRIASNYNNQAKRLYFDFETKGVKVLKVFESKVSFTANSELLKDCASTQEELLYIVNGVRTKDLEQKMQSKRNCYDRYRLYIENEIPIEFIAPIR